MLFFYRQHVRPRRLPKWQAPGKRKRRVFKIEADTNEARETDFRDLNLSLIRKKEEQKRKKRRRGILAALYSLFEEGIL